MSALITFFHSQIRKIGNCKYQIINKRNSTKTSHRICGTHPSPLPPKHEEEEEEEKRLKKDQKKKIEIILDTSHFDSIIDVDKVKNEIFPFLQVLFSFSFSFSFFFFSFLISFHFHFFLSL